MKKAIVAIILIILIGIGAYYLYGYISAMRYVSPLNISSVHYVVIIDGMLEMRSWYSVARKMMRGETLWNGEIKTIQIVDPDSTFSWSLEENNAYITEGDNSDGLNWEKEWAVLVANAKSKGTLIGDELLDGENVQHYKWEPEGANGFFEVWISSDGLPRKIVTERPDIQLNHGRRHIIYPIHFNVEIDDNMFERPDNHEELLENGNKFLEEHPEVVVR